ncbi:hypothetical protein GQ55_3G362900 [Panicum hallii var. hallii]|uniref:Endonuclease/exonuclease/phosphatase domain-containing protein n=1 Tax=Panicum hallii var. hallii TaxID=1504633 RepID=A0A2T7EG42_9POAL|nr:hypothetical protein GQ55_3G362900 [Panicum hallii var. hallii]
MATGLPTTVLTRWSLLKVAHFGYQNHHQCQEAFHGEQLHLALRHGQFQLKRLEPPGFSFQIVNTNLDEVSPRARRRSALLTWQHIASLPPNLPVIYCGGFNTQKESMTGRFLLGRSREHGVVGDMRDAWPNARVRKNVSLIHTYHGFKGAPLILHLCHFFVVSIALKQYCGCYIYTIRWRKEYYYKGETRCGRISQINI